MKTDPVYREKHEDSERFLRPMWEAHFNQFVSQGDPIAKLQINMVKPYKPRGYRLIGRDGRMKDPRDELIEAILKKLDWIEQNIKMSPHSSPFAICELRDINKKLEKALSERGNPAASLNEGE